MKFISICSGIEAASCALTPLGFTAIAFSEIDSFPNLVLEKNHPDIINLGDLNNYLNWPKDLLLQADVIIGGPPCQSFSVAGQRQGVQDSRGLLTLKYVELINYIDEIRVQAGLKPIIVIYENVLGLLSDKSLAFQQLIGQLSSDDSDLFSTIKFTQAGFISGTKRRSSYRVLDSQFFGLAQRRKRIFIISTAREDFCPFSALFETNYTLELPEISIQKNKIFLFSKKQVNFNHSQYPNNIVNYNPLNFFSINPQDAHLYLSPRASQGVLNRIISRNIKAHPVLIEALNSIIKEKQHIKNQTDLTVIDYVFFNSRQSPVNGKTFGALDATSPQAQSIAIKVQDIESNTYYILRRISAEEAELLQGFPVNHTYINSDISERELYRLRIKAIGNSMAVPVISWLGTAIINQLSSKTNMWPTQVTWPHVTYISHIWNFNLSNIAEKNLPLDEGSKANKSKITRTFNPTYSLINTPPLKEGGVTANSYKVNLTVTLLKVLVLI